MATKKQTVLNRIWLLLMIVSISAGLTSCGSKGKIDSGVAIRPNGGVIAGGSSSLAPGQSGKAEGGNSEKTGKSKEIKAICIVYTGDVHGSVANAGKGDFYYHDDRLTYSSVAGYKQELLAGNNAVFLVDAGDALYGNKYASATEGQVIVDLMNEAGYNVAVPGDTDFYYGMDRFLELKDKCNATFISCNLYRTEDGVGILPSYCILESGGVKVAFVGVLTPEAVSDKKRSRSAFFSEDGEKTYDILFDEEGDKFYAAIQRAVDAAKSQADYVVLISHLGAEDSEDMTARPDTFSSKAVIMSTKGIDVCIDAHSNNAIEGELVPNMAGGMVVLTSAGKNLEAFGEVKISKNGKISSKLITEYDYRADNVYELERTIIGD